VSTLDSRSLTYVSTFGRRFGNAGRSRYRLVSPAVACQPSEELPFTIEVGKGEGGAQHDVRVLQKENRLVADPDELAIGAGDLVLWHSLASTPGYVVQGEDDGGAFDSSSLTSETLYTHAFGEPGDYEWADARNRAVSGTVSVGSLDAREPEQCREWTDAFRRGTVVMIEGERSDPPQVSILAGQTVFFAVAAADGITVTDVRLLRD
jgi:plastocyanin